MAFLERQQKQVKWLKVLLLVILLKAIVTTGRKVGTYTGRVVVRLSGSFDTKTTNGVVQGTGWKYCRLIQKVGDYLYN